MLWQDKFSTPFARTGAVNTPFTRVGAIPRMAEVGKKMAECLKLSEAMRDIEMELASGRVPRENRARALVEVADMASRAAETARSAVADLRAIKRDIESYTGE